jgi:hypothetical protein
MFRQTRKNSDSGIRSSFFFLFSFLFIVHCSFFNLSAQELTPVVNRAFKPGERFRFRVYYDSFLTGKVTAGVATLEVKPDLAEMNGRYCYHIVGEGKSKGAFNWFFKVDDRFESYIDTGYLVPWFFVRHTREGDYRYEDEVRFNHFSGSASSTRKNKKIPPGIQDILSSYFFLRNADISNLKPGNYIAIHFFLDDSVYVSRILYDGKEIVETDLGAFRCLRFKPMVATGNVFSQPYPMEIWVTDDLNHIPILAKSAVIVGSVKMELTDYRDLANPMGAKINREGKK